MNYRCDSKKIQGTNGRYYFRVKEKALRSRDKTIIYRIEKLEKEYEKELDKLEKETENTMDPKLRQDWKQTHNEYSKLFFT